MLPMIVLINTFIVLTGISLFCYGLLCKHESLMVEIKDAEAHTKGITIKFSYPIKRRIKGFQFCAPEWLVPAFHQCMSQLDAKKPPADRFFIEHECKKE